MLNNYHKFINETKSPQIDDWIIDNEDDIGRVVKLTKDGNLYVIFDKFGILFTTIKSVRFIGTKHDIDVYNQSKKYNL
jgi:hypothetical protein